MILFRYEECFDVYRDIIKNSTDDYEDERETNLAAVMANLCIEGSVRMCYTISFIKLMLPNFLHIQRTTEI
jgi:hypothetical protein